MFFHGEIFERLGWSKAFKYNFRINWIGKNLYLAKHERKTSFLLFEISTQLLSCKAATVKFCNLPQL